MGQVSGNIKTNERVLAPKSLYCSGGDSYHVYWLVHAVLENKCGTPEHGKAFHPDQWVQSVSIKSSLRSTPKEKVNISYVVERLIG